MPLCTYERTEGNRFEIYVTRAIGLLFRLCERLRPSRCCLPTAAPKSDVEGREAIVEINSLGRVINNFRFSVSISLINKINNNCILINCLFASFQTGSVYLSSVMSG